MTAIPFTLAGGDSLLVCVRAWDQPDLCPPNQLDSCWMFYVPTGGPVGAIVEPLDATYSACDPQGIYMTLNDINGVVDSTIVLSVNGVRYTTADPELSFVEPRRRGSLRTARSSLAACWRPRTPMATSSKTPSLGRLRSICRRRRSPR